MGGVDAVADEHRLAALKLACYAAPGTPAGWLAPEPRGVSVNSGNQLVNLLQEELLTEEPRAWIFKVVGSDIALRYKNEINGPTVVVCRADGSAEAARAKIEAAQGSRRWDLFLTPEL